jgi:hypothetical protein
VKSPPVISRGGLSLALIAAAACESALINPIGDLDKCPPPTGEFPPTDCALVRGSVRSRAGVPLQNFPVRVDSAVGGDYYYVSELALTDSDGKFSLTVYRINRLEPPADPDAAGVEIKTYPITDPKPRGPATGRVAVLMYFAELGRSVRVTFADLIF